MEDKKKGFTLIELLAVIAILAIIVVIAIVAINGVDKNVEKIGQTISKESILKAASNYANEYLINSNVWSEEKTIDNKINEIYCINVQTLVKYGFLPKEVKNNDAIKIIKDENQKITTKIVENNDECDVSIPIITIDIENNATFDEVAKFNLFLEPAIAGGKINYSDFYYTIYNESNNEIVKVDCGKNKTSCIGTFNEKSNDNYYGKYKVIGTVARNVNNYNTVERDFTINELSPNITLTASGTKGNNNYYISPINVTSNVDDNNKFNFDKICVFDNEIDANNEMWNNECISPTNLDDNYSNKYVCARYEVKSKPGKYKTKCEKYLIDTKLPNVSISNGSYSSSKINVNATVDGDYSDGVKYAILDNNVSETNGCSNSNFTNITSNTITSSYNTNVSKAIWLKDNAGNCKKQAAFGVGIDTTTEYKYDDTSNVIHNINSNYTIDKIIYNNSFDNNVTYSINSTKNKIIATDKPVYVGTEKDTIDDICKEPASNYAATETEKCKTYSCNNGGKVSGSTCVGNVTFNGSTSNYKKYLITIKYAPFTCSTKGYSYNESNMSIPFTNTWGGGCPTGYTKVFDEDDTFYSTTYKNPSSTSYNSILSMSDKTMGHPSYDSCTTDKNFYVYFPYTCTWKNYAATCTDTEPSYSCKSGYTLIGSNCYSCSNKNANLNNGICSWTCSTTVTVSQYSYGRYAVLYTIN